MSYALSALTRHHIRQAINAQDDNPALLAAAVHYTRTYAQQHRDADEVAALAATLCAAFLPPEYRMGYGPDYRTACPADDIEPTARYAAKRAAKNAAAGLARENRTAATLSALADADPLAIAAAAPLAGAPAILTLPRGENPDPEARAHTTTTARDVLAAAVSAVTDPEAQDTLRAAIAAWLTDPNRDRHRSLVAALATRTGIEHGTAEWKRAQRRIARALKDVQPHERAMRHNPHDRDEDDRWQPQETDPRPHWTPDAVTLSAAALSAYRHRTDWNTRTYLGTVTRGPAPLGALAYRDTRPGTEPAPHRQPIPRDRQDRNTARRAAMPNEAERLAYAAQDRDATAQAHDAWTPAPGDHAAHVTAWHRQQARTYRQRAAILRTMAAETPAKLDADALPDTGRYATRTAPATVTTRPVTGWTETTVTPVPRPLTTPAYIDAHGHRYPYDWTHSSGQRGLASDVIVTDPRTGTVRVIDPATGTTTYGPVPADRWTPAAEDAVRATLRPVEPRRTPAEGHDDADTPAPRIGRYAAHGSQHDADRVAERRAAAPAPGPVKKPSRRARNRTGSTGPTVPALNMTGSRSKR